MFGILLIIDISKVPRWVISMPDIPPQWTITVTGELFNAISCEIWSYVLWTNELWTAKIGFAPFLAKPEVKPIACSSEIATSI